MGAAVAEMGPPVAASPLAASERPLLRARRSAMIPPTRRASAMPARKALFILSVRAAI
jgi:hypothetical protein